MKSPENFFSEKEYDPDDYDPDKLTEKDRKGIREAIKKAKEDED